MSDNQLEAIRMLLSGRGMASTANTLGVDRKTLYRWRQDPSFCRELERARREVWSEAAARLRALVHPSLDILEADLRDKQDRTRFRAANAILRISDLRKAIPLEIAQ